MSGTAPLAEVSRYVSEQYAQSSTGSLGYAFDHEHVCDSEMTTGGAVESRFRFSEEQTVRYLAGIDHTIEQIQEKLRDDPADDEQPITRQSVAMAKSLLRTVHSFAENLGRRWIIPTVTSDDAGDIHLSWRSAGRRALLIVNGRVPSAVVFVRKDGTAPSQRSVLSFSDAAERVATCLPNRDAE